MATKEERVRDYAIQRNYEYDSHDEAGNYTGLTEDQWKDQIREEWSWKKLKAHHVVLNFHDKDVDKDGLPKPLHVHGCVYFKDNITQSEAIKRTGCSSDLNCKAINNKSQAYRYLLHITERAIEDGKHVYDEDCLEYSIADGRKFDYHKVIKPSVKDEDALKGEALIKQTIKLILQGEYGEGEAVYMRLPREVLIMMGEKSTYERKIHNAIAGRTKIHQQDLYNSAMNR